MDLIRISPLLSVVFIDFNIAQHANGNIKNLGIGK